ncbi:hypothetical protein [Croceicoccus sp. Ery15]|uniref:hypothetical protein n=1 Tax=Croceicoccus sp. Ery15 TaxID=1703338 RepID=UPI001E31393E|nr:hypothetical protein [Croceicoccus sp. Ery15]
MLKLAYPPRYSGGLCELREPVIVVGGNTGTHERALVCSIFKVQVHVSSPAWAGMLLHGRWLNCVSVDHGRDEASQFEGRDHCDNGRITLSRQRV